MVEEIRSRFRCYLYTQVSVQIGFYVLLSAPVAVLASPSGFRALFFSGLPAAGNRNYNGSFNNQDSENGNYWSSSVNTSDKRNAWHMNFNGTGSGSMNNNDQANGNSVRCLRDRHLRHAR